MEMTYVFVFLKKFENMFSYLRHCRRTELCYLEQRLDCDDLVVVLAAFRIFLNSVLSSYHYLVYPLLCLCAQPAAASVAQMLVCPENTL